MSGMGAIGYRAQHPLTFEAENPLGTRPLPELSAQENKNLDRKQIQLDDMEKNCHDNSSQIP